jgi:hypothetical protein
VGDGGGVHGDLVGAGVEESGGVGERAHATTDGEGHEEFACGSFDGVEQDGALFVCGGDIEEHDFVGARGGVPVREFGGIAGIDEIDELNALDDASVGDIEAGEDALGQHAASQKFLRI